MALEPNPGLHPPLGFLFKEGDGTRFRGTSWPEVIEKVRQYREQHGKPAGDVSGDVFRQVCKNSPQYCRDESAPKVRKPSPRDVKPDGPRPAAHPGVAAGGNVVAAVTNWIARLMNLKRKGQLGFVPVPEARRRAAICAQCPKQTSVTGSCGGCMNALRASKAIILSGQGVVEKAISGCKALGEDTSVSIHLVQGASGEGSLPANCWRKNG